MFTSVSFEEMISNKTNNETQAHNSECSEF